MTDAEDTEFSNDSYTFFGPVGMAFSDDNVLDETKEVKIVLSIILGICMVLSIVGNVCTCAVIIRDRSMRTPTNCYLFNLAVTDLLMCFFVPIEIYIIWIPDYYPLGEEGCRIHFIMWDSLSNCSVLTISALTVERYLVVSKPFLRQKLALKSRVYKIVAIIWVISFAFCIPDIFFIDLSERKKSIFCYINIPSPIRILFMIELVVFFLMPLTLILMLYLYMAIKLKSTNLRRSPFDGNQNRHKAVKMLAAVAASFFFCWFPYCILRIMFSHPGFKYEDSYSVWRILNFLCYNGYVSTAINPILYSLMSRKFRQAFKDFFKGRRLRYGTKITNTPGRPNSAIK
ncbi:neuropeptides capa receptor-like [Plodia interpunctella]|uniref:neuropeptides capa receptor-like n=1 Tax=Plodia interpunctella TaxID=58824 RepID=UPI0023681283|nr:neuropeptides capa receptor-like [Plodia interpunctella]